MDYSLNNLYSYVRSNEDRETAAQSEQVARLEEQEKILALDDIVDDDSSLEDAPARPSIIMVSHPQVEHGFQEPKPESFTAKVNRALSASPPEIITIDE